MDSTKNTLAIIINRQDYRENDSLATIYTRDFGRLTLMARGTKKLQSKLAAHLEPLTLAEVMIISGKGRDYIGSAVMRESYQGIRNDLNKLYYAGQVINLFRRLVEDNEREENLFSLLSGWLVSLDNADSEGPELSQEKGELLLLFFTVKLLTELGYKPEMYNCLHCGQPIKAGGNYFNLKNGGLVDNSCFAELRRQLNYEFSEFLTISDDCVKLIRYLIVNNNCKIKADLKTIKEANKIISSFVIFIN